MKLKNTYPILLLIIGLWIGFVGAISFMEAWLKFRAEGVTLPIGLAIGSLVFNALNKVEIVLSILVGLLIIGRQSAIAKQHRMVLLIPIVVVIIQSLWLLPALDERVQILVSGGQLTGSSLHLIYVLLEVLKIVILSIIGLQILTQNAYR